MAKRRFHLVDDAGANKFWEVWTSGGELHTQYGRIGTSGKVTVKKIGTSDAATKAMAKLVAEKTGKGYVEVNDTEAKAAPKKAVARAAPRPPPAKMDEDGFWDILSRLNWKKSGDDDAVLAPAVKALAQMKTSDIEAFEGIMAQKLYVLDTREHARAVYKGQIDPDDGDQYISADDFLYARCVMIVNGRETYEAAVKDPKRMMQEMEFEAVLSLAQLACEEKGEELRHARFVRVVLQRRGLEAHGEDEAGARDERLGAADEPPPHLIGTIPKALVDLRRLGVDPPLLP